MVECRLSGLDAVALHDLDRREQENLIRERLWEAGFAGVAKSINSDDSSELRLQLAQFFLLTIGFAEIPQWCPQCFCHSLVTNRVSAPSISGDSVNSFDNGVGNFTVRVVARSASPSLWK
jgi:hypothetical protein